jgi:hypothetical protein
MVKILTNRYLNIIKYIYSITDIKREMDSPAVRRKIDADEGKNKRDGSYEVHNALQRDIDEDNSRFVQNQRQQTKQIIDHQDHAVEQLGHAVDRLHSIGKEINIEIKEQNVLLDQLGEDVDTASNRMNSVQEALGKLLQTKDGCQIWTIVILALVLVILSKCPMIY